MDQPSTTPAGPGSAAPRPGTEDRERNQSTDSAPPGPRPGVDAGGDAQRLVKQGAAEIGREARDAKDSVKQAATDAAVKARDAAAQGAQQAKQQAGQLAAQLRDRGASLLDEQKGRAADLIGDCVAATRRAAQKLHDENDHNLAGYADAFADALDSTGRSLREKDARRLVDDAADLARRRPEWVLGGMFVAGLALARFLKASRPEGAAYGTYRHDRPREFDAGGYGGGDGGGYGGNYGSNYSSGYGGTAREYGSPLSSPGDTFGQGTGAAAPNLAGATPGTLDTPGVTTTATGSWSATGGTNSGAAVNASAVSGPDPTITPASIACDTNIGPTGRDNPEAP